MILDTGAIVLRPYSESDHEALVSILTDPEIMHLVLNERPFTTDEADTFIRSHLAESVDPGFGTISLKATNEPIGFAGYRECHYLDERDLEFGWVIATPHHGRGYATALGENLIAYALGSIGVPHILAACNPLNAASEHILRDKLKMRFERQVEPRPGFRRRVYSAAVGWQGPTERGTQHNEAASVLTVRSALPSDAVAIAALHAESWRTAYRGILCDEFLDGRVFEDRRNVWQNRLSKSPTPEGQFVALIADDMEAKGFVCVFLDADPDWGALLDNLHVRASERGKGLGRRLMAVGAGWVLRHRPYSPLHLWVYEKNFAARRFYEQLGGVITDSRVHTAPDGGQAHAIRYVWRDLGRLT